MSDSRPVYLNTCFRDVDSHLLQPENERSIGIKVNGDSFAVS